MFRTQVESLRAVVSSPTAPLTRSERRPNVLLITRNLPPLRGGMERLNRHMAEAIAEWGNLTVIGPSGCREYLSGRIEVIEVPVRPLSGFLLRVLYEALRSARQPLDIVVAGSGLTAVGAILASRRARAKSIAYVHGLDLIAPHPLYRALWLPALRRLDHALANSANTAEIAIREGVASGRVTVIHPGVTLPEPLYAGRDSFRSQYELGNRPILLSVGRLTVRKGLTGFIRNALPSIQRRFPDVLLVVIGDDAPDALTKSNAGGGAALRDLAVELGISNNLMLLGPCDDETLNQAYFAADVHVFPVRDVPGDVEGFGMVAIEAAAHNLPTVAFKVGGIPDAVRSGLSGFLVLPGDYAGFAERVCEVLGAGRNAAIRSTARETAKDFTWDLFATRIHETLRSIQEAMDR